MHIPVLLQEVLESLSPKPGEFFVDGTLGGGGHATALIRKIVPGGTFLGIDRDKSAINAFEDKVTSEEFSLEKLVLVAGNYSQLGAIVKGRFERLADGILLDLGMSSIQLGTERAAAPDSGSIIDSELGAAASARGFSFLVNDPLLMTYEENATPVYELLSKMSVKKLSEIISDYSQERFAKRIAKSIKESSDKGKMKTTFDLVDAIKRAVPSNYEQGRIHPATRTFMALRIYANKEMEHLEKFLDSIPEILSEKGRVGIISFHSLEDRMVKNAFKEYGKRDDFELVTKKAITASLKEMDKNPRSRSAKYRVLSKR